jgi:hypothetical protein
VLFKLGYALRLFIHFVHRNPLRIFTLHPCRAIYFLPTAAKSKQKAQPTNKTSNPNN